VSSPVKAEPVAIAALCCFGIGIINLVLLYALRWGLDTPFVPIVKIVLISGGILFSPLLLSPRLQKMNFLGALCIVAALSGVLLAYLSPSLSIAAYLLLFIAGGAQLFKIKFTSKHELLPFLGIVFAFAIYVFLKSHLLHYAGVYSQEYALLGILHRDTQLQAAIANMIHNYGSFSIGAGSLDPIKYHFGVYIWLAPFASITGAPIIQMLPFILRVIIYPLFLFSIFLSIPFDNKRKSSEVFFIFAIILSVLCVTELIGFYFNWLSESYIFSLIFLFLALGCVPYFIPLFADTPQKPVAALPRFCLFAIAALISKLSVGLLLLGFAGYLSLRYHRLRWQTVVLGTLLIAALWFTTTFMMGNQVNGFGFFPYLLTYGPFVIVAPFLPFALLVFLRRCATHLHQGMTQQVVIPARLLEGIGIVSIAAFAIPNVIDIESGSGWYFLDVPRWIGLWALLLWLPQGQVIAFMQQCDKNYLLLLAVLVVVALGQGVASFKTEVIDPIQLMAKKEIAWNKDIHPEAFAGKGGLLGPAVIAADEQGYGRHLLEALKHIIIQKDFSGKTAIYIPSGNFFWSWPEECIGATQGRYSRTQGFYFQAMPGIPVLNSWPYDKHECDFRTAERFFGQKKLIPPAREDQAWICSVAQKNHFDTILLLSGDKMQSYFKRVNCNQLL